MGASTMLVVKATLPSLILVSVWIGSIEGLDRSDVQLLKDVENLLKKVRGHRNWADHHWKQASKDTDSWRPNKRRLISRLNQGIQKDEEAEGWMREVCDSLMDNYVEEFDEMIQRLLSGALARRRAQEHLYKVARRAARSLRNGWNRRSLRYELRAARKDRETDQYNTWRSIRLVQIAIQLADDSSSDSSSDYWYD